MALPRERAADLRSRQPSMDAHARPPCGVPFRSGRCAAVALAAALVAGCSRPIQVQPHVIADAQLGARVKTVLVNDAPLGARVIEVRVTNGVVTLSGVVWSADESTRAVTLVRAVPGVVDVRSQLVVRAPTASGAGATPPDEIAPPARQEAEELRASQRRLLAVGAAVAVRHPLEARLTSAPSVGPLLRLGTGRGLGPAVGFSWFNADLSTSPEAGSQGRVTIRPVMGGAGYTLNDQARWVLSLSVVAGVAFNSFTLEDARFRDGQPVEVQNSFAARPGVSIWFDLNSRVAFNVFTGYVVTRPTVTFLQDGQFTRRAFRADTAILNLGVAYKVF